VRFLPSLQPLSRRIGKGCSSTMCRAQHVGDEDAGSAEANRSLPCNSPSPACRTEVQGAGKGTSVRHGIAAAGAVFPSASVNGQTPDKGTHSGSPPKKNSESHTNCAAKVRECTGLESPLTPTLSSLKGVGFFSRGWHGGRDARVPSVACAGNASVSLAWWQKCPARQRREQARPQKPTPLSPLPPLTRGERAGSGGILHAQEFVNSGSAVGITIYTQRSTPTLHQQRHQSQQQHTRAPTTPVP